MSKRQIKKILIIGGIFIAAVITGAIIFNAKSSSEITYTATSQPTLPVVSLKASGISINTLYGNLEKASSDEAFESLTPLGDDHKLPIEIKKVSDAITGISYEIRSVDGGDLIEETEVTTWSEIDDKTVSTLPIKDILEDGVEYRLTIKVDTEKAADIEYYTRVVYSKNYKVDEMMEYVSDFHESTFSATKAEKYAINWEVDGTMDSSDLAHVNIHSTFDQLTYSNLAPKEIGEPIITVLEMDSNFGSFLVRFMLEATNEEGETDSYYAEEFFCVQWSDIRFFLMSYERFMTQIFEAGNTNVKEGSLSLGICDDSRIDVKKSSEERYTSFVSNGDLWVYSAEESELTEVFSAAENRDDVYRIKRDYDIKVVSVDDEGNTSFVVYGYMNSGEHEGKNGLSYLVYNSKKNVLDEVLFIKAEHDCETIGADLDRLLYKVSEKAYLLCDDAVFEIDEGTKESVCVIEGAAAHSLKISEDGSAIAHVEGGDLSHPKQIQVKYLLTGESLSVSAPDDEYIRPVGFSLGDFVYTRCRVEDAAIQGLNKVTPGYSLCIVDKTGAVILEYEKTGIMIKDAKVLEGQIIISRMEKVGGSYKDIENDILMQNENEVGELVSPFSKKNVSIRGKVLEMRNDDAKSKSKLRVASPDQISYYDGELLTQTKDQRTLYLAYVYGHLVDVKEKACEAISSAYEDMGYVTSNKTYRVWHRKAKEVNSYEIRIPEIDEGINDKLEGSLKAMLTLAKADADVKGLLSDGMSASEVLGEADKGIVLDLEGCTLKQIYLYIEKGYPVLALDASGEPVLIVGYDKYNIIAYNPTTQENYYIGENDAKDSLEVDNSHMIALIW